MGAVENYHRLSLGRVVSPSVSSGSAGANNPQPVSDTVRSMGPLPAGHVFELESDVASVAMLVTVALTGGGLPSAANLRAQGRNFNAGDTLDFVTPDEGASAAYLIWCKQSGASDGTGFRVTDLGAGLVASLA